MCVQVWSRGWPDGQGPRCPSGPHPCSLQGHPGHPVFQALPHMMGPPKSTAVRTCHQVHLLGAGGASGRQRARERDCRPQGALRRRKGVCVYRCRARRTTVAQRRRSHMLKDWFRLRAISVSEPGRGGTNKNYKGAGVSLGSASSFLNKILDESTCQPWSSNLLPPSSRHKEALQADGDKGQGPT